MEQAVQERIRLEKQLEAECYGSAQLVKCFGALNFMKPEDLEDLLGHRVDFEGILASYPEVARRVDAWERDSAVKDEILEKCKTLLNLLGECDDGEEYETATAGTGMISRATSC